VAPAKDAPNSSTGENRLETSGGRVLAVTALGADFDTAAAKAYAALSCIEFKGMYYRRDIGDRVCSSNRPE